MRQYILIILSFCCINPTHACDCISVSLEEGYSNSSEVVLGKILKKEIKYHILDTISKDSIENQFDRLVFNDTIQFVEYTVQIIKNFKNTQVGSELVIRGEARGSNCDLRLQLGSTYILYGNNNWWQNLYYPQDKYFVLSSICTRTTENWKKEKKELEKYLRKQNKN